MSNHHSAVIPFRFESNDIRTIKDKKGEPWFVAKDVCDILGLDNVTKAMLKVPDNHKGVNSIQTLGGNQTVNVVDEPGLYRLILRSDKPQAEPFMEWVTSEVLPAIRKTGGYKLIANEKKCSRCQKVFPASNFRRSAKSVDGLSYYCNGCMREYQRPKRVESYRRKKLAAAGLENKVQPVGFTITPDKLNKLYLKAFYFITDCHDLLKNPS